MRTVYQLKCGDHSLELGRRTCVMGIVNITPDSFSDGGRFFGPDIAVAHAQTLVREGADIIDIGGESTRPFSDAVPAEEEIRRVVPVIKAISGRLPVPISIDTTKAVVAQQALDAGASIINDVSALRFDPEMAALAARRNVPVILMHMLGNPKTMQVEPAYEDVVAEIKTFLTEAVQRATDAGIERNRLVVDPGIGFGKTVAHNLCIIHHLADLQSIGVPVLVGPSRKAFIRKLLRSDGGPEPRPDAAVVENGTQAAVCWAVFKGAHIVRVHDVARTRATVKILDALFEAGSR
jgi:dihydropteroate synthase